MAAAAPGVPGDAFFELRARELHEDGFTLLGRDELALLEKGWAELVSAAATHVRGLGPGQFDTITSARLQHKFSRAKALPAAVRPVVDALERVLRRIDDGLARVRSPLRLASVDTAPALMDCYALRTCMGCAPDAFEPQPWHMDSLRRFPTAVAMLSDGPLTEFARGPYADLPTAHATDEARAWLSCWDSAAVSQAERDFWSAWLGRAGALVRSARGELDWSALPAVSPRALRAERTGRRGDMAIFWANKLHRGPATAAAAAQRDVLFCSWAGAPGVPLPRAKEQSETDYTITDSALNAKVTIVSARTLRLAARAASARA